jgi:hypothetical protein
MHDLSNVEWRVHAIQCAKPNLKLRKMLERGVLCSNLLESALHTVTETAENVG